MEFLRKFFGLENERMVAARIAREICSTSEGQEFARKFLYAPGHEHDGFVQNEQNKKFWFYEPLRIFFEYCD